MNSRRWFCWYLAVVVMGWSCPSYAAPPLTGPATEKRFPPLRVPKGFKATLFACDPLVEYVSVIALGPQVGSLFVAHDYVTGLGIKIVRRDEVRLIRDTNGDGYADKSSVFANGFNSIQGLAYYDGSVFVMHAPKLTWLKDSNGDGKADQRRDIVVGLGLPPEQNTNRLHCANGVVAGHDGWLYLALGDRGCDVKRPEGDRLLFQEGGILRCRADGSDLHVFSAGLRNIYDVALDEQLNVFVRDNENDGGDYMIRVCHSFFGADHGYPYLYLKRPDEAMQPLADLGRGSSAGGTTYLESAYPKEFRDSLFFCEWGRAVVRYRKVLSKKPFAGTMFQTMNEEDFAAGAPNDPYGFKPTDLVVDYDGSMLVSDWGDGQRPKRGRGRIYRIRYHGADAKVTYKRVVAKSSDKELIDTLNSPSYYRRVEAQQILTRRGRPVLPELRSALSKRLRPLGRLHAVWILAHIQQNRAIASLLRMAKSDSDARVRAQAIRAIGDLSDPLLIRHRLAAGRGDTGLAKDLAALIDRKQDSRVVLEVLATLGRLRWKAAPAWLAKVWHNGLDQANVHAAMQLLRRSDNWPAVLKLLDGPPDPDKGIGIRRIASWALADRSLPIVVDGLVKRIAQSPDAAARMTYLDLLGRVYKRPAAWKYWGFRPASIRPVNPLVWEKTKQIQQVMANSLHDPHPEVRMIALVRMREEKMPVKLKTISALLEKGRNPKLVKAILDALRSFPRKDIQGLLDGVVSDKTHSSDNRLTALTGLSKPASADSTRKLLLLAKSLEGGPVLAAAMAELGRRKGFKDFELLLANSKSSSAPVRAISTELLGRLQVESGSGLVVGLLKDTDIGVRRAAAFAAGKLRVSKASNQLRILASSKDPELCRRSLESLLILQNSQAVPQALAALKVTDAQVAALAYLARFGSGKHVKELLELAKNGRSSDRMTGIVAALNRWRAAADPNGKSQLDDAIAKVHQISGMLIRWTVVGPLAAKKAKQLTAEITKNGFFPTPPGSTVLIAAGTDAHVRVSSPGSTGTWLAGSNVVMKQASQVECLASAGGAYRIWLNGKLAFQRQKGGRYQTDGDRFTVKLQAGLNHMAVRLDGKLSSPQFHLRFRQKSSQAEHERLIAVALKGGGNAKRGEELFRRAEKSLCMKCHRTSAKGPRIGPDLSGIGRRFSRIHLVESILQPSRTIAPSYATVGLVMTSGLVLTGVKVSQTSEVVSIGTKDGQVMDIPKAKISLIHKQTKSIMPEGLEKRFSDREFLDLIAYLQSLTQPSKR